MQGSPTKFIWAVNKLEGFNLRLTPVADGAPPAHEPVKTVNEVKVQDDDDGHLLPARETCRVESMELQFTSPTFLVLTEFPHEEPETSFLPLQEKKSDLKQDGARLQQWEFLNN